MATSLETAATPRWTLGGMGAGVLAALLAVYLIWGSTYLAIRYAVETMPPFLMAGSRWLVAGAALLAWRRAAGDPWPTLVQWRSAAIVGLALVVGGNGLVSLAETEVPSGLTALLIAIVPVHVALIEWLRPGGARPPLRVAAGIALGFAGVALLVLPSLASGGAHGASPLGLVLILVASLSWASGSLWSRTAPLPRSVLMGAAMEMLAGGAVLVLLGALRGEAAAVDLAGVGAAAWASWAFLVVFGSIVAYSAYVWLLQTIRAEVVATYAFVNPVVAVLLGAAVGERLGPMAGVSAALIVVAVALVVTAPRRAR